MEWMKNANSHTKQRFLRLRRLEISTGAVPQWNSFPRWRKNDFRPPE
jgi:hypothetical protein